MRWLYPIVTLAFVLVISLIPSRVVAQHYQVRPTSPSLNILPSASERFFKEGRQQMEREILRLQQVRSTTEESPLRIEENVREQREQSLEEREIHSVEDLKQPVR